MDATGYVRLSRAARSENLSLAGMVADVERLAALHGFRLVNMHVDDGISGAVRDRPDFLAWLSDIIEGRAQVMLTYHTDRLTREGLNVAAFILDTQEGKDPRTGKVVRAPVRYLDCKGLDSDHGTAFRLQFALGAEVARAERERMSSRSKDRVRRLRDAGRWSGGAVPFGFEPEPHPDGAGMTLRLLEEGIEPEALARISEELRAGRSPGEVSRGLNAAGIRPRRAAAWTDITVRKIVYGRTAPIIWPPGELHAIRKALEERSTGPRAKGGRPAARLLSGLLVCYDCRETLSVAGSRGKPVYRCQTRSSGRICTGSVAIMAEPAEVWAEREYIGTAGHLPYSERITAFSGADEISEAEAREAALSAQLLRELSADVIDELKAVRAELEALRALPVRMETVIRSTGRSTAEEWEARDIAGRRAMLAGMWQWITVLPAEKIGQRFTPDRLSPEPVTEDDYDA